MKKNMDFWNSPCLSFTKRVVNFKNLHSFLGELIIFLKSLSSPQHHNSGQVGCPEIIPYCGIFPYFANGQFGPLGVIPYFASPYCERLLYHNFELKFGW